MQMWRMRSALKRTMLQSFSPAEDCSTRFTRANPHIHKLQSYLARGKIANKKGGVWFKNTIGCVKSHGWTYADLHLTLHLSIKDAFEFLDV